MCKSPGRRKRGHKAKVIFVSGYPGEEFEKDLEGQTGYAFLPQLADSIAQQISIESAQPRLDLGVLKDLSSKKIMLGVLDLGNPEIETAEVIADRIRHGLKYVAADRLIPAPDCGMKYMPRHIAFGKLKAMCDAAATVRKEIS